MCFVFIAMMLLTKESIMTNTKSNKKDLFLSVGAWPKVSKAGNEYWQGYFSEPDINGLLKLLEKVAKGEVLTLRVFESNSRNPNAPTFSISLDTYLPKKK